MKWRWAAVLGLVIVLASAGAVLVRPVGILVNGRKISTRIPLLSIDGYLTAPVQDVAAALGAGVSWDVNSHVLNLTANETAKAGSPAQIRYYPRVPDRITSPPMALQAYFDALSNASNLTAGQGTATGGTAGMGTEPYPTAYGYWSKEWQARHSYTDFLASWQGTAHLDLLKLLPAGEENGRPRFFAEVTTSEVTGAKPHLGVFYYTGFFTTAQTPQGWRITGGQLDPETFDFGGHQPWRTNPRDVARAAIGGSLAAPLEKAVQTTNSDGTVKVGFTAPDGKVGHWAVLVQTKNGRWLVIDQQ